ncbi:MAG: hypothetical protein JOZ33_10870 [Acidobacteriaceae bacterium]|nr:hypothetical protein [Acidobacteriaceae bacterium]
MRRLTYPLAEGAVTDESAAAIRETLRAGISKLIDSESAVYQAIPKLPGPVDLTTVQSFREVTERLAHIQSEVSVARSLPSAQAKDVVKRLADTYGADAVAVPSVALEILMPLRDTRQWAAALSFMEGLPPQVRDLPVIREQRALVLSKSGKTLEAIAEIEALIRTAGDTSERSGLIGGRYKGLYESSTDSQSKALYLNRAISSYHRGMMLDLNDYYPSSNLPRLYRERGQKGDEAEAMTAAQLAMAACRRSLERNPGDPWALPTLLGAAFDSGDVASARELLDRFQQAPVAPFEIDSTIPDLRRSLGLLADGEAAAALAAILAEFQKLLDPNGTITALAGRRIDGPNGPDRRFPPENEKKVAWRIANTLVGTASTGIVSSAACGADILALECAEKLGLRCRVILPFTRDRFRSTSVADRGEEWGTRFDAILGRLEKDNIVQLNLDCSEEDAYVAANARILDEASHMAETEGQRVLAAVIWNGVARGPADMTEGFRQLAARRAMEIVSVRTL